MQVYAPQSRPFSVYNEINMSSPYISKLVSIPLNCCGKKKNEENCLSTAKQYKPRCCELVLLQSIVGIELLPLKLEIVDLCKAIHYKC